MIRNPNDIQDGELAYLKNSHRHIFFITAEFPVRNANREIEIISQQNAIKRYLLSKYGDEDGALVRTSPLKS